MFRPSDRRAPADRPGVVSVCVCVCARRIDRRWPIRRGSASLLSPRAIPGSVGPSCRPAAANNPPRRPSVAPSAVRLCPVGRPSLRRSVVSRRFSSVGRTAADSASTGRWGKLRRERRGPGAREQLSRRCFVVSVGVCRRCVGGLYPLVVPPGGVICD